MVLDNVHIEGNKLFIDGHQHAVEKNLCEILDLVVERITDQSDQNAYSINHGDTGSGKTNSAIVEALWVAKKTSRPIHLYFKLHGLLDFAKRTSNNIIIWDEPAFTSLSTDHASKINKDLLRLINTSRLKRHYVIINFTKFWRFPVDVVVDTALFFIHMSNEPATIGNFLYIGKSKLESLWNDYQSYKTKNYLKYKSFNGTMPYVYKEHFNSCEITIEGKPHCTYQDYLDLRDKAVNEIGRDQKIPKDKRQLLELRLKVARMAYILHEQYGIGMPEIANAFGSDSKRFREWRKIDLNSPLSLGNEDFEASGGGKYVNTMSPDGNDDEKEAVTGQ